MSRVAKMGLSVALLATAVACDNDRTGAYLTRAVTLAAGDPCARGGTRVEVGIDDDGDGLLDAPEVRASTLICQGQSGTLRVDVDGGTPITPVCPSQNEEGPPPSASWHAQVSIVGHGFLPLRAHEASSNLTYYGRDLTVHQDSEGCLANSSGFRLQGYTALDLLRPTTPPTLTPSAADVCLNVRMLYARPTRTIVLGVNLDAASAVPALPFDRLVPSISANASAGIRVYDSLGNAHAVTIYFARVSEERWDWHALVDGGEISGATRDIPLLAAQGTLHFTPEGALRAHEPGSSEWNFVGATQAQQIVFSFGTPLEEGGNGLDGSTSFAAPSAVNTTIQDGYAPGALHSMTIESDGLVRGVFTNGERRALAKLALASFPESDQLLRVCDALWMQSDTSGEASLGPSGTPGRGVLVARTLE